MRSSKTDVCVMHVPYIFDESIRARFERIRNVLCFSVGAFVTVVFVVFLLYSARKYGFISDKHICLHNATENFTICARHGARGP